MYGFFTRWRDDGTWERLHDALRDQVRVLEGRDPLPTAAVIDSQSVKAAETVGAARRGYDAGKKINGVKRHVAVDTLGLLLVVMVTAASVQDRDGAFRLLSASAGTVFDDPVGLGRRWVRRPTGHLGGQGRSG